MCFRVRIMELENPVPIVNGYNVFKCFDLRCSICRRGMMITFGVTQMIEGIVKYAT